MSLLITDILTGVGALGVIYSAGRAAVVGARRGAVRWRYRASEPDYYLRSMEIGYRIVEPGKEHLVIKREEVVALQRQLEVIRVLWRFEGDVEVAERYSPTTLRVEREPPGGEFNQFSPRRIHLVPPLKKGQSCTIVIERTVTMKAQPLPPYLSWSPIRRTDRATLRIVFAERFPPTVQFLERGADGLILNREELDVDPINKEARKELPYPIIGRRYEFAWPDSYS